MNRKLRRENNRIRRTQEVMGPKYQAVQLAAENTKLRASIRALIEIYVPHDRKAILLREHLEE